MIQLNRRTLEAERNRLPPGQARLSLVMADDACVELWVHCSNYSLKLPAELTVQKPTFKSLKKTLEERYNNI